MSNNLAGSVTVRCSNCKSLKRDGCDYVCGESNFLIARAEVNDSMLCNHYKEKKASPKPTSSQNFLVELGIAQPGDE